jgi:membrane-bound metal-dependent hydrolase YbcI (DUF457 family)
MPSPIGHALGGIAAGWLFQPLPAATASPARARVGALAFAGLGMAADLDLLASVHRGPSHSLGATMIVGLLAWAVLRGQRGGWQWAIASAAAYGSHVLLDWVSSDTSPPIGLQACWPWSSAYYEAPWEVFLATSRRVHQPDLFWVPNALAIARELIILVPVVALVYYVRRVRPRRRRAVAALALVMAAGAVHHTGARSIDAPAVYADQAYADQSNTYVRGVVLYLSGAFDDALTTVAALTDADIAEQSGQLTKDQRTIQAAAMLHTELAFRPGTDVEGEMAAVHLTRARRLVHELRRIQSPGEFQRGWYLLVSAELQGERALELADKVLAEARDVFPRDPDVLVATGASFELRTFTSGRLWPVGRTVSGLQVQIPDSDGEVRNALASSARYFAEAVAVAPAHDEARLRLGRVLYRTGQADRAADELDIVRRSAGDPILKYLATLFEGAAEMSRHRPERATTLYLEALGIVRGQAAWIGLSAAYYDQGRGADAANALQALFRAPPEADPWLAYLAGDAWHTEFRLSKMRALVTQR